MCQLTKFVLLAETPVPLWEFVQPQYSSPCRVVGICMFCSRCCSEPSAKVVQLCWNWSGQLSYSCSKTSCFWAERCALLLPHVNIFFVVILTGSGTTPV
jgi:hypothetical protein